MNVKQSIHSLLFSLSRLIPVRRKLPILIYHRVLDMHDPFRKMEPDINEFAMQMKVISENYQTMHLTDAVRRLKTNKLPRNGLCITFDDGYKDNLYNAAKILKKYDLTATFFIASSYTNNGAMWNDKILDGFKNTTKTKLNLTNVGLGELEFNMQDERISVSRKIIKSIKYYDSATREKIVEEILNQLAVCFDEDYMMTSVELKELHDMGMEIGGHTSSHPILANLSDVDALREIVDGKEALEKILGTKLTSFAYPNGRFKDDYNKNTVDLVQKAGFECAVTTNYGTSNVKTAQYELNRISCWQKSESAFSLYLIKKYFR